MGFKLHVLGLLRLVAGFLCVLMGGAMDCRLLLAFASRVLWIWLVHNLLLWDYGGRVLGRLWPQATASHVPAGLCAVGWTLLVVGGLQLARLPAL